jgi:hypothetical protein
LNPYPTADTGPSSQSVEQLDRPADPARPLSNHRSTKRDHQPFKITQRPVRGFRLRPAEDDFEQGMWNGKLSTLRWVLGSEWDFLDT